MNIVNFDTWRKGQTDSKDYRTSGGRYLRLSVRYSKPWSGIVTEVARDLIDHVMAQKTTTHRTNISIPMELLKRGPRGIMLDTRDNLMRRKATRSSQIREDFLFVSNNNFQLHHQKGYVFIRGGLKSSDGSSGVVVNIKDEISKYGIDKIVGIKLHTDRCMLICVVKPLGHWKAGGGFNAG